MRIRELRPQWAAIFFLICLIALSCEKPERGIGGELLPDEDILNAFTTDTISVIAWNSPETDSVRTSPASTGIIGSYHDPIMGIHRSEIYTQFRLPISNVDFAEEGFDLVLDSAILNLDYTGSFYGFLNPLTFEVYEMNESISLDSIYYSNAEFEIFSQNLVVPGRETITPNPFVSTILLDSVSVENRIRLPLDLAWAERFLDPANTDSLATSDTFTSWFKGLYIKTQANSSALVNVDLTSAISNLTLHYRGISADSTIERSFSFLINDNAQRINRYLHNYSASLVDYYLADSVLGQQRLFLQGAAGQNIEIDIPFIENWKDSTNIAVNKAELVFPIEDVKSGLSLPLRIFAVRFNEEGEEASTPDILQGDQHVGGFLDLENNEYRINITRYMQQILNGQIDYSGLRIKPSFNATTFERVSIFGFENPEKRAKLEFTYTKF